MVIGATVVHGERTHERRPLHVRGDGGEQRWIRRSVDSLRSCRAGLCCRHPDERPWRSRRRRCHDLVDVTCERRWCADLALHGHLVSRGTIVRVVVRTFDVHHFGTPERGGSHVHSRGDELPGRGASLSVVAATDSVRPVVAFGPSGGFVRCGGGGAGAGRRDRGGLGTGSGVGCPDRGACVCRRCRSGAGRGRRSG